MIRKTSTSRDAYACSLTGIKAMSAFGYAAAIADDEINNAWARKFRVHGIDYRHRSRRRFLRRATAT